MPLARKYRPQTFEDLVGQPHVTTPLTRAIEAKRVGQAYLFTGQRGVGKTSAARILAKCLNCVKGPIAKPCQQCPSCLEITGGSSLDVIEIDGASNRGIDEIRSLRETVKFAPTHGAFRIYIIDEVHQITHDGFNALLKTLEEPPAHVKFIFATTTAHKVPATILSRCQRFDFRRLNGKTIVPVLKDIAKAERIAIEDDALYTIARAAEGSLRDAEVILEQLVSFCAGPIQEEDVNRLVGAIEQDALLEWMRALLDHDANAALLLLSRQLEQGKEVTHLLVGLLMHLRNLLILRTTTDPARGGAGAPSRQALLEQLVDLPTEQLARLDEQAKRVSAEELLMMAQVLAGAYELIRRSPFAQAILEFVLIKLATRDSWTSLAQVIERLEQLSQSSTSRRPDAPLLDAPVPPSVPGGTTTKLKPNTTPEASAKRLVAQAAPPESESAEQPSSTVSTALEAAVSLEQALGHWPQVLARLAQQKMSLAAYLADARPLRVMGSVVQVGLPAFVLHQEVLNLPENLRLVEQVLSDVVTQPLTVDYTTLPASQPSQSTSSMVQEATESTAPEASGPMAPPILQDIVKLFDATIVNQPPKP